MAKYAVNLSDDLNDSPPGEMASAEDVSVESDDAADEVQIVGPAHIGFNGIDDTCNDRPLAHFDQLFRIEVL